MRNLSRHQLLPIFHIGLLTLSALMIRPVCAPAEDLPEIRRRFVPASRPDLWPQSDSRDWVPVRKSELKQLLENLRNRTAAPSTIPFSQAAYAADFNPATLSLLQGTASLDITAQQTPGGIIHFAPLNLTIAQPGWAESDLPAILGSVPGGDHYLIVPEGQHRLAFDWELTGAQRLSGVEFTLRIPAAVASSFTISVPRGWTLTATVGTVTRETENAAQTIWRLDLGQRTEASFRLIDPEHSQTRRQTVLTTASLNSRFDLTPLVVDATLEVSVDTAADQASSLDVELDEAWQIRSIERVSGGAVQWQDLGPANGQRRLRIEQPQGLASPELGFVISASRPVQSDSLLKLEPPRLKDAVLFDGRLQVSLGPPFTLQEYSVTGLSQTDVSAESGNHGRSVLSFHQFAPEARLQLKLRHNGPGRTRLVSVREFSVGRFDLNPPELHADLQISSRSREIFSVDAWVPRGWELTRVAQRIATGLLVDLPWRVIESPADGPVKVQIRLPDGLETSRPAMLQISAQHATWTRGTVPVLPALFPDVNALTSVTTGLVVDAGTENQSIRIDGFEPVDSSTAQQRASWSPAAADLTELPVSLHMLDYWEDAGRLSGLAVRRSPVAGVEASTGPDAPAPVTPAADSLAEARPDIPGSATPESVAPAANGRTNGESSASPSTGFSESRPVVTTRLDSFMASGNGGRDLHRMTWQFAYPAGARSLSVAIPQQAVLLETRWNDRPVAATADGSRWTIPVPAAESGDTLTVSYSLKSRDVYLRDTRHIELPDFDAISTSFEWNLHLRKGYAAVSISDEMTRLDAGRPAGWLKWFFGPLARSRSGDWFNPMNPADWRALTGSANTATAPSDSDDPGDLLKAITSGAPQTAWNTVRSYAGVVPGSLSIHICRIDRLNALAWFVLVTTCLIGVTLRTYDIGSRNRIGLFWLTGCLAAATMVPDRYAELIGAAILGTVITTLLPRSLLRPPAGNGSSVSYPTMASTVALARDQASRFAPLLVASLAAFGAVAVQAQSEVPKRIEILSPYQGSKLTRASRATDVVYIDAGALQQLQRAAASDFAPPAVLLTEAHWDGIIDSQSRSSVEGKLILAVAPGAGRTIEVPVPASLVDPGTPVLLDGTAVTALPHFDGRSILVPNPWHPESRGDGVNRSAEPESDRPAGRPAPPTLPETASADVASAEDSTVAGWQLATVELSVRPQTRSEDDRQQFVFPVSPVASGSFRLKFEVPPAFVVTRTTHAPIRLSTDGLISLHPGPVDLIGFDWSSSSSEPTPDSLTVDIRSVAEIYPGRILRQTLAKYSPAAGTVVSQVAWRLPPYVRLAPQQIRVPGLVDTVIQTTPDGRIATLEFEPPHTAPFTISMNWQQILSETHGVPEVQWEIPVSPAATPQQLTTASHLAGIKAAPGFTLSSDVLRAFDAARVSADQFLTLWPENGRPRSPQIAVRISGDGQPAPKAGIVPITTQRSVRQNLQARIESTQVRWTISAEIETSNAPAFLHELEIPEDVRIDSVSLQRDEVDRLSHWERRGDRLFLFLRDRSTGIQNVRIEGRQKLERLQPVTVPAVRVKDAQLLASTLQVYSRPDIRPQVHGAEVIERPVLKETADRSRAAGFSGEYRLSGDTQVWMDLQAVEDDYPLRWLGFVDHSPEGRLNVEMVMQVSTREPREWTLEFPDWVAGGIELLSIDGMDNVSSSESVSTFVNGTTMTVSIPAASGESSEIRIRLPVRESFSGDSSAESTLRLPPPACEPAAQVQSAIVARADTGRMRLISPPIPDAQRAQSSMLLDADISSNALLLWSPATEVSIQPESASVLPAIVLHSIRSGGRMAQICRTRVLVNSDVSALRVAWPPSIDEIYRRIDGQLQRRPLPATPDPDADTAPRIEVIELQNSRQVHHLEFLWKPSGDSTRLKIRRESIQYPHVTVAAEDQQFIEIIPSAGVNILPTSPRDVIDTVRNPLTDRVSAWQNFLDSASAPVPAGIARTLSAIQAAAAPGQSSESVLLAGTGRRGRVRSFAGETDGFHLPERGLDQSLVLRATGDTDVRVWLIDRRVDLILLGVIVGLAVIAPILKFFSLEFGERLARRPVMSFALIGLVWWSCLQGSAAGFILLLSALVCWMIQSLVLRMSRLRQRTAAA